jgi:hypothetical protein
VTVLDKQLEWFEPLSAAEQAAVVRS